MRFVDLTAVEEFRKFHFAGSRRFMAVAGGKVIPGIGLDEIKLHAFTALMHHAEIVLRRGIFLGGGLLVPF